MTTAETQNKKIMALFTQLDVLEERKRARSVMSTSLDVRGPP